MPRRTHIAALLMLGAALAAAVTACQDRADQCELNANCPLGGAGGTMTGTGGGACPMDHADCNGIPDDGCEIDLATDGHHCGACGHDCQRGGCQAGLCMPFPIVASHDVGRLVEDGDLLYYVSNNTLWKVPKSGATKPEAIFSDPAVGSFAEAIEADSTSIFWIIRGTQTPPTGKVMRIEKDGTGLAVLASNLAGAQALTIDESSVYWTVLGTAPNFADRAIMKSGKDGAGTKTLLTSKWLTAECLAVTGSFIYLAKSDLLRIGKDGGPLTGLGSRFGCPLSLGNHVYFMNKNGLVRVPDNSEAPEVVSSVVNGNYFRPTTWWSNTVYLTDVSTEPPSLWSTPASGGAVLRIGGGLPVIGLVADDEAVYVSTSMGPGFIMKLVL